MTPAVSPRPWIALRVAMLAALAALLGCGPGTGGTGLPPGGTGTQPEAAATTAAPVDAVQAPTAAAPSLLPPPATPADLEGPITAIDALTVTVAGVALPRALLDAVGPDGRAALPASLAVGVPVRVWRPGERWLLVVPGA